MRIAKKEDSENDLSEKNISEILKTVQQTPVTYSKV